MPVTAKQRQVDVSQRVQYAKGGVGRVYWDWRDRAAFAYVRGNRVLDAGCGEGVTLEKLVACMPRTQVLGVDVDPDNARICNEHGLFVERASIYELPFRDASFDACLFMEVIEHLEHPERALSELARVTRPGGRVVVVFPNDRMMYAARLLCLRWREARFDPGHLRQWNFRDLRVLMRECGLRPVVSKRLPLPGPFMLHGLVVAERES